MAETLRRILHVEDDPAIRRIAALALGRSRVPSAAMARGRVEPS